VTEPVRPGEAVLEQGEAQGWVEVGGEEWVAPEPVQVLMENALVLNAERPFLMKSGRLVTL